MDKYFKERMDEIQLRTEQMAERKTYESEIDSLEEKLKGLESNYRRLETTWKSNIEESALKRVDLVVAKEIHAFAEDQLSQNQALLVEEKRKLGNLHRQVWDEEIKACNEVGNCLADNDSVSFLNEYPRVLKMHKYAFLATPESDDEIKQLVAEHPEVKQLGAEIAALETEIRKAEDSCFAAELEKVFTEIRELKSNDNYQGDETEKLIEALERSHRERMTLEEEIVVIKNRKIVDPRVEMKLQNLSQKELKDFPQVKNEPWYCSSNQSLTEDKNPLKTELKRNDESPVVKEKDKKIEARKWYEEYAREAAATDAENHSKDFYSPLDHRDGFKTSEQRMTRINSSRNSSSSSRLAELSSGRNASLKLDGKRQDERHDEMPVTKLKFSQKIGTKRKSSGQYLRSVKSRFLNEDADAEDVSVKIQKANRKFKPLVATPSTFLKSAAETALDDKLVQSGFDEAPSTSVRNVINVKKIAKFTPKRPSNIGKKTGYRQTKLDDFDNFMLRTNKYK